MWLVVQRARWLYAATAVIVACAASLGPRHSAAATTTGVGFFEGVVTLPFFPCANCGGATLTGRTALSLSGLATTSIASVPIPYTAVWASTTNNLSAAISYDEACAFGQPPDLPPLGGSAGGTFYVTGGEVVLGGGTLSGAALTGTFTWVRVGVTARMTFDDLVITASSNGSVVAINLNSNIVGEGAGGLVWTNGPGTCATQQTNQTAVVAGVALQVV